jgi:hypothetical protein
VTTDLYEASDAPLFDLSDTPSAPTCAKVSKRSSLLFSTYELHAGGADSRDERKRQA